jgi:hypothetical protein
MVALKEFYLDETLDWDITIHKEYNSYLNKDVVTNDDLVKVLKGEGTWSMTGSDDGPEFKALRNQLEELGYITCERMWWNGDRVVKSFKLNGIQFKKDQQFSSGAALKFHMEFLKKHPEYAK